MLTLVNSQTMRQDRTWKSTQDIFFADAKVKAWSVSNGIRFSDGPSPPFFSRAEARKQSGFARATAADETSEDIANTIRQCEPSLGRDPMAVEVARTEKTHPEEPHWEILGLRPAVAGPVQVSGNHFAEQSLIVPVDAMVSSCSSKRTSITMHPGSGLPDAANLPPVLLDRRIKSSVLSNQTNGVLSSGSLGIQCSAPLMCSDLSASKCLIESENLYPVVDRAQFVSRHVDYGTNESSGSPLEQNAESPTPSEDTPFSTPLGYHIPKAKLQEAIDAAPSVMAAYWQYTLYQGPGGEKDKVKVHYCKSKDATERISQLFLDKEVIGFDIEWMMNATAADGVKRNVALIQIASEERIALFHIARYANATNVDDFVAPTLKSIMESTNITKVGVSVKGDCTRLRKYLNIEARGIFELSHLYKLVKFSCGDVKKINKVLVNLAQQVKEHLQLPLWKGEVRSSDWSQDLNYQQIQCEPSCFTPAAKGPPSN